MLREAAITIIETLRTLSQSLDGYSDTRQRLSGMKRRQLEPVYDVSDTGRFYSEVHRQAWKKRSKIRLDGKSKTPWFLEAERFCSGLIGYGTLVGSTSQAREIARRWEMGLPLESSGQSAGLRRA